MEFRRVLFRSDGPCSRQIRDYPGRQENICFLLNYLSIMCFLSPALAKDRAAALTSFAGTATPASPARAIAARAAARCAQIGRESGRERVRQYVWIEVVAVSLNKTYQKKK